MHNNAGAGSQRLEHTLSVLFTTEISAPQLAAETFQPLTEFIKGWIVPGLNSSRRQAEEGQIPARLELGYVDRRWQARNGLRAYPTGRMPLHRP